MAHCLPGKLKVVILTHGTRKKICSICSQEMGETVSEPGLYEKSKQPRRMGWNREGHPSHIQIPTVVQTEGVVCSGTRHEYGE